MNTDLSSFGRFFLILAALLGGVGLLLILSSKVPWLGRLPGDVLIQKERLTIYIPLMSCLLASVLLSIVLWLIGRFHQ